MSTTIVRSAAGSLRPAMWLTLALFAGLHECLALARSRWRQRRGD